MQLLQLLYTGLYKIGGVWRYVKSGEPSNSFTGLCKRGNYWYYVNKGIVDFDYIVTSTELESLILEITLIKKYYPKYNILLKDDKSYPYIEYTRNPYPSLKVVRYLNIKKHSTISILFYSSVI